MAPKGSKKRAAPDDGDQVADNVLVQPAEKRPRKSRTTALYDGETNRQKKMGRRAAPQEPPKQQPFTKVISRGGSGISKRTLSGQSSSERMNTHQEVFADRSLAHLNSLLKLISALSMRVTRGPTSAQSGSVRDPAQTAPKTAPPLTAERLVDELFAGHAIPGRNWRCEIEEFTAPKANMK